MKSEDGNDAKKAVAVHHFTGGEGSRGGVQGTGGVRGPAEVVGSFHPFSAASVRGLLLPSTAKQVNLVLPIENEISQTLNVGSRKLFLGLLDECVDWNLESRTVGET